MASNKLKRDYPYLAEYLDAPHSNPLMEKLSSAQGFGCVAAVAGAPIIGIATFLLTNRMVGPGAGAFLAFGAAVVGAVALSSYATKNFKNTEKNAAPEEKLMHQANAAIQHLKKLDGDRKLPKWMDPVAIQLLEAGAYHWSRVRKTFGDVRWDTRDLPEHWVALREKAERAANLAMAELIILCTQCVGEPHKTRKGDFQSVLEDIVDLDIEDALRGLAKATATHPTEYRFSSPRTQEIFPHGKELAERLKDLAEEIEQATQIAKTEIPELRTSLGQDSIETLLSEMRYVRQAEEELHEHQSE